MQRLEEKRRLDQKRQEAREKFRLPAGSAVRWVLTEGPDKRHRIAVGAVAKPTKDDPEPRKGEEMVKLPPQWPGEQSEANVTWPVIVRLRPIVQGVVVDARKGVIFNAWRTHGPERWEGERYAIVAYTSIAWHRLPAPMRTELLDLGFPW